MPLLTEEVLADAIEDIRQRIWNGAKLAQALVDSVAKDHEISAKALSRRFYSQYPSGEVGNPPPSSAGLAELMAQKVLDRYRRFIEPDGRKLMLNGKLHTMIWEGGGKVHTFRHHDMTELAYAVSELRKMDIKPPET